ncbi:MAG: hypothetical protein Kow0080_26060 [Candidatus Promineifilaceae bacterium]
MFEILNDTITPWILGALAVLASLTLGVAAQSWRDIKRSPYFFMRRQAEKRLQSYLSAGLLLVVAMVITGLYAWQTPDDPTPRAAILANTKPPEAEVIKLVEDVPVTNTAAIELELLTQDTAVVGTLSTAAQPFGLDGTLPFTAVTPELPAEFDKYEPTAELRENTHLGAPLFSTEIDSEYQSINARTLFPEGRYTLYATFSYEGMADGMEWAWVWRRNGEVVEGGNELWAYGEDGPGYIFLNPDEGFQNGEYTLEIWVNGELLTQGQVMMNSAAVTAGN